MDTLYIFYDPNCGLCARFRRWMEAQRAWVRVTFVAYDSAEARVLCPDLLERGGDREIIVMAEDGRMWQGGDAWIVCLWSLHRWRRLSRRLASAPLRPLARQICHAISNNRFTLSQLLRLESTRELAEVAEASVPECDGGCSPVRARPAARNDRGQGPGRAGGRTLPAGWERTDVDG